jgi:predicted dehydrogenase
MKVLVVGLGSMGKRRVRCLKELSVETIIGFDPREDRRAESADKYGIDVFASIDRAFDRGPDALIISTPPDLHMRYAKAAVERGIHFFCEASVTDDGMAEVMARLDGSKLVGAPSCTMRFHPAIKIIKENVENNVIGRLEAFTHHAGQWLPDWHPWEDYRSFYVSKRATGACREIVPFELSWLTSIVGDFDRVAAMRDKVSDLECDIDDIYQLLLHSRSGVYGHLMVDVLARHPVRSFRLVGREGTIDWVSDTAEVRIFTASDQKWRSYKEPVARVETGYSYLSGEAMYVEETQAFLQACKGVTNFPYTLAQDHRVLGALYAAERSSDAEKFERVN